MSFIELPLVNPGEVIESSYNNQNKHNTDYLKVRADKVDKYIVNPMLHVQNIIEGNGESFTAGAWRTRPLNTLKLNTIEGADIDFDTKYITLPAGQYEVEIYSCAFYVRANVARLYNITKSEETLRGTYGFSDNNAGYNNTGSEIYGRFTIDEECVFILQHYCTTTRTAGGFGYGGSAGDIAATGDKIYADLRIYRIGD